MKTYNSNNIRNIAVAGHAGRGKTTLCEAMLYTAGATKRFGKVADGSTVCRAPLHALSGMTSKSI